VRCKKTPLGYRALPGPAWSLKRSPDFLNFGEGWEMDGEGGKEREEEMELAGSTYK